MGKRKVIIGLDQLCFLSGFEISGVDFNAFFYACMIEAGVEEFEVLNLDKADSNLNELDIAPPDSFLAVGRLIFLSTSGFGYMRASAAHLMDVSPKTSTLNQTSASFYHS